MAKISGVGHDRELKKLAGRSPKVNSQPIEAANGGRGVSGAAKKRVGITALKTQNRRSGGPTGVTKGRIGGTGKQWPGT